MKVIISRITFTDSGIELVVDFTATGNETFTTFSKTNYFDSSTFNVVEVTAWVQEILSELKSQLTKVKNAQSLVGTEYIIN